MLIYCLIPYGAAHFYVTVTCYIHAFIILSGTFGVVCNVFIFMYLYTYCTYCVYVCVVFRLCHWSLQICCRDAPATCRRRGTAQHVRFLCGSREPFMTRCVTLGKQPRCSVTSVSTRISSATILQTTVQEASGASGGYPCFYADCRCL